MRREHDAGRTFKAEIVTVSRNMRPETAKFAKAYSELFGMKSLESGASRDFKASLHIFDDSNFIRTALTSPPAKTEVGPSFMISRIDWGQVEDAKNEKCGG